MKAKGFFLLAALSFFAATFAQDAKTFDEGVIINDVKWATRNVDKPGTFAAKPEDKGMLYQWNLKKAWSAIEKNVKDWNGSYSTVSTWEKTNDPSPVGWRVPTKEEIETLFDENKVTNEWTTRNGVKGRKFTDKTTGSSIFLPAVGSRSVLDGTLKNANEFGSYWSSTGDEKNAPEWDAYSFEFNLGWYRGGSIRGNGFSIRCVAETENERITAESGKTASDFRAGANAGNKIDQYYLGECYAYGLGVTIDYVQAANWWRKAAEQGLADAQHNLGVCYEDGVGVTKNYTQAVYWYRKAAEQGMAEAQQNLGNSYYNGNGVTKDYTQAIYWWCKSAEQGDAQRQYSLGFRYYNGDVVTKDYTQAVYWWRKAAEQGLAEAQNNLGACYYEGVGVTKSYTQAVYWCRKAAEQGYAKAQTDLGLCYFNGNGVTKDYTQAVYWFRRAAEQGMAKAQYYLGSCYDFGLGVSVDGNTALYLYEKSIKNVDGSLSSRSTVEENIKRLKEQGYSSSRTKIQ